MPSFIFLLAKPYPLLALLGVYKIHRGGRPQSKCLIERRSMSSIGLKLHHYSGLCFVEV